MLLIIATGIAIVACLVLTARIWDQERQRARDLLIEYLHVPQRELNDPAGDRNTRRNLLTHYLAMEVRGRVAHGLRTADILQANGAISIQEHQDIRTILEGCRFKGDDIPTELPPLPRIYVDTGHQRSAYYASGGWRQFMSEWHILRTHVAVTYPRAKRAR